MHGTVAGNELHCSIFVDATLEIANEMLKLLLHLCRVSNRAAGVCGSPLTNWVLSMAARIIIN